MNDKKCVVGVVCGGRSAEHRASLISARDVLLGIEIAGYQTRVLGVAKDGTAVEASVVTAALADGLSELTSGERAFRVSDLEALAVDVVFPLLFGEFGCDDGALQSLCRWLELPCVGPSAASAAIMFDKGISKAVLTAAELPVLPMTLLDSSEEPDIDRLAALGFPLFVKPATLGCSIGCAKADDKAQLAAAIAYARPLSSTVLVEPYRRVRELAVGVIRVNGEIRTTGAGETRPPGDFYDHKSKWSGEAHVIAPARVEGSVLARARDLAARAFRAVGGSGMARADLFYCEETRELWINEMQPYPCLAALCVFPLLWQQADVPFPVLLRLLIEEARQTAKLDKARVVASASLDLDL